MLYLGQVWKPGEPSVTTPAGGCLDRVSQELFAYPLPHSTLLQSLRGEELNLLVRVTAPGLLFMVISQLELIFAQ